MWKVLKESGGWHIKKAVSKTVIKDTSQGAVLTEVPLVSVHNT